MHLKIIVSRGTLIDPFVRLERRIKEALASPDPSFVYPFTEAADAFDPAYYPRADFRGRLQHCGLVILPALI